MKLKVYDDLPRQVGRWRVLSETAFRLPKSRYHVVCGCECGSTGVVRVDQLRREVSTSCGCYHKDAVTISCGDTFRKHGYASGSLQWLYMRAYLQWRRCNNPDAIGYHNYGGRGIQFRFDSFAEAAEYYHSLPNCSPSLQIDRIDNDGHYEPGNIRFATQSENMQNTRVSIAARGRLGRATNKERDSG